MQDKNKPYQGLEEYLDDLCILLERSIQIALANQNTNSSKEMEYSVADVQEMEAYIRHKREISSNILIRIETLFSFTDFERFTFMVALSVEYKPIFQTYYSSLYQNANISYATKDIAISLYQLWHELDKKEIEDFIWNQNNITRYFIKNEESNKRLSDALIMEEGLIRFLLYQNKNYYLDQNIMYYAKPITSGQSEEIANNILEKSIRIWAHKDIQKTMIQIHGKKGSGKRHIISRFSFEIGKKILLINLDSILTMDFHAYQEKLNKIYANALVMDAVLCFCLETDPKDEEELVSMQSIMGVIQEIFSFCFVLTQKEIRQLFLKCHSYIEIPMPNLSMEERGKLWERFLNDSKDKNVDIKSIVNKYDTNPGEIKNAILKAKIIAAGKDKNRLENKELEEAIRLRQREDFNNIAERINTSYTWNDLFVSDRINSQLEQICNYIKYKDIVMEKWGFSDKTAYGNGISSLFYGQPGTGKTMAAQVLSNELSMDLYRIDLSRIVSKYIGETEKNITEVFDRAKNINAILFFDEADALFAKRSDIQNANDRNANSVTAHLLQKIEDYEGISILSTNFLSSIDDAFKRRIKFMLQFEYPTEETRLLLFQSILSKKAECAEKLDLEYFAKHFVLSGSSIKEILIHAAYMAAGEGGGIKNKHLVEAVKENYLKYGKTVSDEEFGYLLY